MVCLTTYIFIALLVIYVSSTATITNTKEFPSQKRSELGQKVSRVKRQWGWGYLAYPTAYVYRAPYVSYYGSWGYPVMGFLG